jgi:RHS repeat-associated protein
VHRGPAGDRISTWEYAPGSFTPVSQTDGLVDPDDPAEVDRRFYAVVTDLVGAPTELVTPDGEVAWRQRTTIWGVPTHVTDTGVDCPLRFPGQIHDPETGTSYNYHRYYDPDTGRYQSPDPLGLLPGPDPHAYVPNPTAQIDPLGLAPAGCGGCSGGGQLIAGPNPGILRVTATRPSSSEIAAARYMAARGSHVVLRDPVGTRTGGMTSDLLVDGVRWDVYSPTTGSVTNIIGRIAKKYSQVHGGGVIVDLSRTGLSTADFDNALARVNGMIRSWNRSEFIRELIFFGGQ